MNLQPDTSEKQKTRVLYAIEDLEVGGAERLLVQMASSLDRDEFQPVVCCLTKPGALARELEAHGIPLLTLGKKRGIDFGTSFALASIVRRYKIDIIHTHLFTADLWGRLAGILAGVRGLVSTEHSFGLWKDGKRRGIDKILARFTSRFIAVTDSVREFLIHDRRVPAGKITVIHNAVTETADLADRERRQVRRSLGLDPRSPVVCTIGRLSPEKGHDIFLRAARYLAERNPEARFLLVGGGPCAAALGEQAARLGLSSRVVFAGVCHDARKILSAADLFVLPSRTEGLSVALLEALEAGIPAVATNVGGTPDVMTHGETGLLVPGNDPEAMGAACHRLLHDEDLRRRLARNGRNMVREEYSLRRMIQETESVYRSVLTN